ncbi:hypothetical protein K440DRAFT_681298 [Wilcoxina mikolae CBS 423.85]|nr:hypothetical protein K440DRAFT_681298 [Wilcoxina mikolae CBS 423.85]
MPHFPAPPIGASTPTASEQPVPPQAPRLQHREPPLGSRAAPPAAMDFTAQAPPNLIGQTHNDMVQSYPRSAGTIIIPPPPHPGTMSPVMATFILNHYDARTGGRVYGHYSLPPGTDLRTFLHIIAHEFGDSGRTFSFRHARIHQPVNSIENPLARVPAAYRHDFLERVWGIGWKFIYVYRLAPDETGHTHYDVVLSQEVIRPRERAGGNVSDPSTGNVAAAARRGRGGARGGGTVHGRGGGSTDSAGIAAGGADGGGPSTTAGRPNATATTTAASAGTSVLTAASVLTNLARADQAAQDARNRGHGPSNSNGQTIMIHDDSEEEGEIV